MVEGAGLENRSPLTWTEGSNPSASSKNINVKKLMIKVKVLVEGYAREIKNGWKASSTVCLILSNDKKIITDPGCNREALLNSLARENLNTDEIDYVFLSHRHPDHTLLAGLFKNAKHVTYDSNFLYDGDIISEYNKNVLGNDIEILNTPGHVSEHISLIIQTTNSKIAIAGDVFWWVDDEKQILDIHKKDQSKAIDMNMKDLINSRKKLLEIADYIIPGHGKMFKSISNTN